MYIPLYWYPREHADYERRFTRLLTSAPESLQTVREAFDGPGNRWGAVHPVQGDLLPLYKTLLWLDTWHINLDLVLSFRDAPEFTGEDLRIMFTAGLTENEIAAHRDAGRRPDESLTVLAALHTRPFDPLEEAA